MGSSVSPGVGTSGQGNPDEGTASSGIEMRRVAVAASRIRAAIVFVLLDSICVVAGYGMAEVAYFRYKAPAHYWLHFAEGTAMTPLLLKLVFNRVETGPMPFFVRPIAKKISATVKTSFIEPEITQQLKYMEAEIAKTGWFAGPTFSAADIQMSFPLEVAASRGGLNAGYPKLMDFLQRIHTRPAYKRALERGGVYELLR